MWWLNEALLKFVGVGVAAVVLFHSTERSSQLFIYLLEKLWNREAFKFVQEYDVFFSKISMVVTLLRWCSLLRYSATRWLLCPKHFCWRRYYLYLWSWWLLGSCSCLVSFLIFAQMPPTEKGEAKEEERAKNYVAFCTKLASGPSILPLRSIHRAFCGFSTMLHALTLLRDIVW